MNRLATLAAAALTLTSVVGCASEARVPADPNAYEYGMERCGGRKHMTERDFDQCMAQAAKQYNEQKEQAEATRISCQGVMNRKKSFSRGTITFTSDTSYDLELYGATLTMNAIDGVRSRDQHGRIWSLVPGSGNFTLFSGGVSIMCVTGWY